MGISNRDIRSLRMACALAAAAFLALLGGCGGDSDQAEPSAAVAPNIVQPGAPGEPSRKLSAEEAAKLGTTKHTPADVEFMKGMIHHHAQALVMTSMVPDRAAGRDVPLLARRMEISQEAEIEVMERWLRARGEEPPDAEDHKRDHGGGGSLMPGMVSEDELAKLAAADGREFERLFLTYMIRHHRGAVTMVNRLNAGDGGQEPEIGVFTRHVESDQPIEIGRMQALLARFARRPDRTGVRHPRASRAAQRDSTFAFAGGKPRICYIG
jgi:uncharacterized protein (DUF305 family)